MSASANTSTPPTGFWFVKASSSSNTGGVAMDSSGNVWITSFNGNAAPDSFIYKVDTNGSVLWQYQMPGVTLNCVCIDGSGNSYFSGCTSSNNYLYIVKFSSGGTLQWSYTYTTNSTICYGMTVDSAGSILLTGIGGTGTTVFLLKINSAGTPTWTRVYGGSGYEWGANICTDASNSIYVTNNGMSGTSIARLAKFDSSGTAQWGRTSSLSPNGGGGVAVDSSGNIFWASSRHVLTKLNSSGTSVWSKYMTQYNETHCDIQLDSSGNVYVLVDATSDGNGSYLYSRDTSGNLRWIRSLTGNHLAATGRYYNPALVINSTAIVMTVTDVGAAAAFKIPIAGTGYGSSSKTYGPCVFMNYSDVEGADSATISSTSISVTSTTNFTNTNYGISPQVISNSFTNLVV